MDLKYIAMNYRPLLFLLLVQAAMSALAEPAAPPLDARVQSNSQPASDAAHVLDLPQALELAFSRNPDMQAAAERIGQAEAQVGEAVAAFYPKVVGRIGYTYSDDPAMAFTAIVSQRRYRPSMDINHPGFVENFRPEVVTTLSLFRGGQDYYRKKAAELGVEVAELAQATLHNQLAAAVTAAWYAALAAPKQVEAARRSVTAVDSALKQARARHQEGVALRSEVLSLEVRQAEARESELRTLNAVDLTRSGLKLLLGAEDGAELTLRDGGAEADGAAMGDLPLLLNRALTERPEMQMAARQVEMREKELRAELGGHLPRVNAYAAYGLNERSPEFNTSQENLTLGVAAEVDVFAGGATSARVSGARRKLAEMQALQERTRLEIEDEVRKAAANFKEALARRDVAVAAAAAAKEALRLVHEQYEGGTATATRYLEAEKDLANSDMRAVTAVYDVQVARANLHKAVGFWK